MEDAQMLMTKANAEGMAFRDGYDYARRGVGMIYIGKYFDAWVAGVAEARREMAANRELEA